MSKERNLTCIICPRGCALKVKFDEEERIASVEGFTCPRGKDYAIAECTHPVRTLTTTVFCENGGVLAVKTNKAIPKELLFKAMEEANKAVAKAPVRIGDVIVKNVAGTDADLVATENK